MTQFHDNFTSSYFTMLTTRTGGGRGVRVMDASQSALDGGCMPLVAVAMHFKDRTDHHSLSFTSTSVISNGSRKHSG